MNPLEALGALFGGMPTSNLLWAMEENALAKYFGRPRQESERLTSPYMDQIAVDRNEGVAVVPIRGVMVRDTCWSDEVSTIALTKAINQLAGDDSVHSIVLLADSPGGSVAGLEELGEAIDRAAKTKKVVTQVDGMCCSAMYEIACRTSAIYARRDHLVGSVGTRMHVFDYSKLFENIGIKSVPIDTGEFKSTGAMGTELTEPQQAYLQEIVDEFQKNFFETVKKGRGLTTEQMEGIATGRIWTASQAVGIGVIDGIQKPDQTLAQLIDAAPQQSTRRKAMSEKQAAPEAPQKSMSELIAEQRAKIQQACPGATEEFVNAQLDKTPEQASKAWMEKLSADREAAEKRAEDAEKKASQRTETPKKAGNSPLESAADEEDTEIDYRQLAREYQKDHKCRWSEACLAVKKRYPGARTFFGAPPA